MRDTRHGGWRIASLGKTTQSQFQSMDDQGTPGYICTEQAFREGGYEPTASAVSSESETAMKKVIAALL
jgi:hypothetical protein